MSAAQGHMNDKLRNHGLPTPKEAETAEPMSAEERAAEREERAFKIVVRVMSGVDSVVAMTKQLVQEIERFEAQAEQAARLDMLETHVDKARALDMMTKSRKDERRKALEEAAEWHETQERLECGQGPLAFTHRYSAKRFHALATSSEPGEDA